MKSIKFFSILLLAVMVAFASCKKDEINDTNVVPDPVTPGEVYSNGLIERSVTDEDGLTIGCVVVNYPFSLLLTDSSTVVIASEADMNEAMSDSTNFAIDFVYPINVTFEDGTTATANNIEELAALFAACIPDTGWGDTTFVEDGEYFPAWDISFENACIQLVYPVSILSENGTTQTTNNQDELIDYLADGSYYSFVFPISVENQDGTVTSVEGAEEMFDLLLACNPGGGESGGGCGIGSFGCYQFGYPLSLEMEGGSTVVVNNEDEFNAAVLAGDWIGFGFPLTLIDAEGEALVVNNETEMDNALLNCGTVIGGGPNFDGDFICYDFIFPIQIITDNGNTTIADADAWDDIFSDPSSYIEFGYPLSLVHVETGETTVVTNPEELVNALQACF